MAILRHSPCTTWQLCDPNKTVPSSVVLPRAAVRKCERSTGNSARFTEEDSAAWVIAARGHVGKGTPLGNVVGRGQASLQQGGTARAGESSD